MKSRTSRPTHLTHGSVLDDLSFSAEQATALKFKAELYQAILKVAKNYSQKSCKEFCGSLSRQGMILTALGMLIGLSGAFAASRAIDSQLFGVKPLDAITYAGVIVLLAAVSVGACWLPAWRASNPCVTLRAE